MVIPINIIGFLEQPVLEGSQEVCMLWSAVKSDNLVEVFSISLYTSVFLCMYTCTCMRTVYRESIVI